MQTFSPKASSVLEKKIFKGFYQIWAWWPSWSTHRDHFSNFLFPLPKEAPYEIWKIGPEAPEEKLFEILNIFPIQMHKVAKLTLPKKRSNVNVQPLF